MTIPSSNSPEIEQYTAEPELARPAGAAQPTRKIRLGAELPIFCEKCGYALHGLAQEVCERCSIRQFHCPECGHHQPINTLRPAVQKILGRVRAFFLALWVFFKLNFFGWLLVAWVSVGYSETYRYDYESYSSANVGRTRGRSYSTPHLKVRELDEDNLLGFGVFGFFFGAVGRMLLLRWRRGYLVGLVLGTLVLLAVALGAMMRKWGFNGEAAPYPLGGALATCMVLGFATLTLGASIVWPIWSALTFLFLPKRTSAALLEWQRGQSDTSVAAIGRG